MSNSPLAAHRIRTFSALNAAALDNEVNAHLEYLHSIGAKVIAVRSSVAQAGTLLTFVASVHFILAP